MSDFWESDIKIQKQKCQHVRKKRIEKKGCNFLCERVKEKDNLGCLSICLQRNQAYSLYSVRNYFWFAQYLQQDKNKPTTVCANIR